MREEVQPWHNATEGKRKSDSMRMYPKFSILMLAKALLEYKTALLGVNSNAAEYFSMAGMYF
jgi:hypothetical protein